VAKRTKHYPIAKIAATILGLAAGALEIWLNSEAAAQPDGWLSLGVVLVAVPSLLALAALPIAEHAAKAGQWFKAIGFIVLFAGMAVYTISTALNGVGGRKDQAVTTVQHGNKLASLAQDGYAAAQKAEKIECVEGKERTKRCRDAQATLTKAREDLMKAPAERVEDSGSMRITAILPFLTPEKVRLYQPAILPVCLELGAFLMLAFGLSPRRKEPAKAPEAKPKKTRGPRKRKLTAVSQLDDGNVVRLKTKAR
jgi:hypothetical protein